MIILRDFQVEALEAVISEFEEGVTRQIIHLPTGSGKTLVMSAIAKHFNKKTLILAHRDELITQAVDKFRLFWPDVDIGICKAERDEISAQVVVGSVQSCSRENRLNRLKEQSFELLLIDECHHGVADSYQSIINELGFNSGKLLVGVTATAGREGLGSVFEKITYSRSISTMISAAYLSPIVGRKILTNFSLERLRTIKGDYEIGALGDAVNTHERNEFIVEKLLHHGKDRKAIAFCVDVEHTKNLAEAFKKAGVASVAVYGAMPSDERKKALEELKSGQIQVATSCGVLTEGFDEPSVDCILMCRPTKSEILYTQCVGRGLRKHIGKGDCLVLDFTDRGHNLEMSLSLDRAMPDVVSDLNYEVEGEFEGEEIDNKPRIWAKETSDHPFDILGAARFCWVNIGDDEWSLIDDNKCEIVLSPSCGGYVSKVYYPDGTSKEIVSSVLPLDYCQGVSEDFARRHLKLAFADLSKSWMTEHVSPTRGQISYLESQGAYCEGMSKSQAAFEIRSIVARKNKKRRKMTEEPMTEMQKYFLVARGYDTSSMSKYQAMQTISKLKNEVGKT